MANHTLGVDLGQVYDYTAVAIVERLEVVTEFAFPTRVETEDEFRVMYLYRWPHHTPYRQIVTDVGALMKKNDLKDAVIALDGTGVGKQVSDLFRRAWQNGDLGSFAPRPYIITAQREIKGLKVPKRELVAKVQTLLEGEQLRVAKGVEYADILKRELRTFQVKTSPTGSDSYESAREADHDDLVLAVALAVWARHTRTAPRYLNPGAPLPSAEVATSV